MKSSELKSGKFNQSEADSYIYVRDSNIVADYVDDLITSTKTEREIQLVKEMLHSQFKGAVHRYCLHREAVQAWMISQPVKSLK